MALNAELKYSAHPPGPSDDQVPPVTLWCRQVSGEGAHVKKWRVIIRNLPFKVIVDYMCNLSCP